VQVDLLEHYAATMDELGFAGPAVWEELEGMARAAGRWRQATIALRIRGVFAAETDPAAGLALLDAATELAESHGLTEQAGWTELSRAETGLVAGDWDAALAAAERALTTAERYAYERLAFRTWMVALPILAARRDPSWVGRYETWWSGAISHFPKVLSPYADVLRAATAHWIARARGEPFDPDVAAPTETPPFTNPHFLAAREIIAEAFLARGDVERAASLAAHEPEEDWTVLMRASQGLIGAWVARARGDDATAAVLADEAQAHARAIGAAWWVERAETVAGRAPAQA
jgi:hypothetical protein